MERTIRAMRASHPVAARRLGVLSVLCALCATWACSSSPSHPNPNAGTGGAGAGGSATGGNAGTSGAAGCSQDLAVLSVPPTKLSQTGLYDASGKIASWVQPFEPTYKLWSDGADKLRYIYLPKCGQIDTSDMDHWDFPVGTRAWKQFTVNGVVVETRMIERKGPGLSGWIFAAYQWDAAGTDADYVPSGVVNAKGTTHDIPSSNDCIQCHGKLQERLLGFSAIQLTHDTPGATMRTLSGDNALSVPAPNGFTIPGSDAGTRDAIGYLHANCGNCHNSAFTVVDMRLRVLTAQTAVVDTDVYNTAVNVPTVGFSCSCNRITPGDPTHSAIIERMSSRAATTQMPPLATEITDPTGIQTVSDWITALGQSGGGL